MPSRIESPKRRVELQATGHQVRENVQRLRKAAGLTHTDLSERLKAAGYVVSKTAISEIELGARRVSVDDLLALSIALQVNPNALLLPPDASPSDVSERVTGLSGGTPAADVWLWADGWRALPQDREDAPRVRDDRSPQDRAAHIRAELDAEDGTTFLDRIRPRSENRQQRKFLAKTMEELRELGPRQWVSLWWFDGAKKNRGARVKAYPEIVSDDIRDHFGRIEAELAGVFRSESTAPFVAKVLEQVKTDGND